MIYHTVAKDIVAARVAPSSAANCRRSHFDIGVLNEIAENCKITGAE